LHFFARNIIQEKGVKKLKTKLNTEIKIINSNQLELSEMENFR